MGKIYSSTIALQKKTTKTKQVSVVTGRDVNSSS